MSNQPDANKSELLSGRWFMVAVVLASSYLLSMYRTPYTLDFLVKALPILWLAWVCVIALSGRLRVLMLLAMLFSAAGDVLLALPLSYSFTAGLSSFLCAQLMYCVIFYRRAVLWCSRALLLLGIALFYSAMLFVLVPRTADLMIPVTVYMSVICAMGALASVYRGSVAVVLGALCFIISDALIAINKFWVPFEMSAYAIMITYYLAQCLIVLGVIQTTAAEEQYAD